MAESTTTSKDEGYIKLNDVKEYPMWCVQVKNEPKRKHCEKFIDEDLPQPTRRDAIEALRAEEWPQKDITPEFIRNKLKDMVNKWETGKGDAVGVIQARLSNERSSLIENCETAKAMWDALKTEFDQANPADMGAIIQRLSSKSAAEYGDIHQYCDAFQDAYNRISSQLVNKNGDRNQAIHYEAIIQGIMLEMLPKDYAPLVSQIRKEWTDYKTATLRQAIQLIKRYLSPEDATILYGQTQRAPSKKRTREIEPCGHPKCANKRGQPHPKDACWEFHPEKRRFKVALRNDDKEKQSERDKSNENAALTYNVS
jgi:hypothetical protein